MTLCAVEVNRGAIPNKPVDVKNLVKYAIESLGERE
jgi:hypothetical protein